MARRERWWVTGLLLALSVLSALGVWAVWEKQSPENIAAFANRFTGFDTLGFTAAQGIVLTADSRKLTLSWPQSDTAILLAQSEQVPINPASHDFAVDIAIGGTQNADGASRFGYRVWLEAVLYRQGEAIQTKRVEIPLESDKKRARLYALRAAYGVDKPDSYALRLLVEPLDTAIAAGTLTCTWLEVTP